MDVPQGEVLLDGRVMRPDGSWSGVKVAGEVVRGTSEMTRFPCPPVPLAAITEVHADVFWFETFMERLTRDLQRKDSAVVDA